MRSAAFVAGMILCAAASFAQIPRMADGHPDLNGLWQAFVTANWDLQDHEAQPGPHPEIVAEYGAEALIEAVKLEDLRRVGRHPDRL